MSAGQIEELLNLLDLRVDASCICTIADVSSLQIQPLDKAVVYFTLAGEGAIETRFGRRSARRGSVSIVPRRLATLISGNADIRQRLSADHYRPLQDGLVKFKVGDGDVGLVLGCASVEATVGGVINVFQHLSEPIVDEADEREARILDQIEHELSFPQIGTRAVVEGLLKHILIVVFRKQLSREAFRTQLWPAMLNPQLGQAALAIMSRPQDQHTIDSLAAIAGLSRSRFTEVFTQSFGRSPMDFLQVVRLRTAKRLLMSSSLPVKSIAAAVGYASRSHFSRVFQAEFGKPPAACRTRQEQAEDETAK